MSNEKMDKANNHKDLKKPLKLEDLPRENMFKVPDGYFDELPGIIQSRVSKKQAASHWWQIYFTPANGWKVALATAIVVLVLVFGGIFDRNDINGSMDQLLADVSLEDLIEYVEYSNITTDEILAEVDLSEYELDFLMGDDIKLLDDGGFEELDFIDLYEIYGIEEELF